MGTTPTPGSGQEAANRRFPSESETIAELIRRDEMFRGLCEDLATSDAALEAAAELPGALGEERRAECREWVESLSREIEEALQRAKVISLAAARSKHLR